MKRNLLPLALLLMLFFVSCEEEWKTLILLDYAELDAGTTTTLNIDAGNPPYQVTPRDNNIVTVTVDGSRIIINAREEGETVLLVTDQKKQQKNIQVRVGIPPVGFVKQYSSGNMQEVLSEFGVSWEEENDQVPNEMSVIIKPREAGRLISFRSYEWLILNSRDLKEKITSGSAHVVSNEGIRLKVNKEELFHYYFGVNLNGNYYLFHISNVEKTTNPTGEIITTITGEYKKAGV